VKLVAWCTALLLLVGAAVALDDAGDGRSTGGSPRRTLDLEGAELAAASRLHTFADCDELLGYYGSRRCGRASTASPRAATRS
jgi:hypothetical protein